MSSRTDYPRVATWSSAVSPSAEAAVWAKSMAAATLGVSCLSMIYRSFSGVIAAALVVQLCAVVTDLLMAAAPIPVLINTVTGARVHMLRWCKFNPLAFPVTLLTEGGGMANDPVTGDSTGTAWVRSTCPPGTAGGPWVP